MRRFLILFSLIVFVTVSCAGPSKVKVGWTKPDFRQDQFQKDRKDCIQTLDNSLDSQAFGKALEECLAQKGYKYETPAESPPDKPDKEDTTKTAKVAKTIGKVVLVTAVVAVGVPVLAACAVIWVLAGAPGVH